MLRTLLQTWLQNTAKAKLRGVAVQAVREQLAGSAVEPIGDVPRPCHLGLVFALGIESGCLEDLLQGMTTIKGDRFTVREGGLGGRRVAMVLAGPGRQNAMRATEALIDGHRPATVFSAGFAGALCSKMKRNDILLADRVLGPDGCETPINLPAGLAAALQRPGVHGGLLLTADRVVRLPADRQSLFERHGAVAVDMETAAVAETCARRGVPFSSIRVINDTADETLPRDIEYLLSQKSGAAQWGAALGAIMQRPASAKDMYQLRENALVASNQLAKFVAGTCF